MHDLGIYFDLIYKDFLRSPQANCYDMVHQILFEDFSEQDLEEIKKKSGDKLKCILIHIDEPHWYDEGDSVSQQFKVFMGLCRKIGIYNADFYVPFFGSDHQQDFKIMNKNYFGWNFMPYNVAFPWCHNDFTSITNSNVEQDIHVDKVQYKFLHMNFTHRMHRQLFSKFLIRENLIDTNCVAINLEDRARTSKTTNSSRPRCISVDQNDDWHLNKNLKNLWRDTPLKKVSNTSIDNHFYLCHYGFLKKAGVYIVSETMFNHPSPYFSEKTVSALLSNRPFIIIGEHGSLRALKQKGYKTFNDMFDESYDNIIDPSSRMESIFELVKDINARSLDEIKENVLKCQDKLSHNRNLMMASISRYTKKVNATSDVSSNRKQI
jgi:hypothetical protein